jgi:hypothetical protein
VLQVFSPLPFTLAVTVLFSLQFSKFYSRKSIGKFDGNRKYEKWFIETRRRVGFLYSHTRRILDVL